MSWSFRKLFKVNYTLILILIGLSFSTWLLFKNEFFCTYDVSTFNNIVTPIATILAFVIYYATLVEIKNSNNKNIGFHKINLFKERIENLKTRLENTQIEIPLNFQESLDLKDKYNLTSFFSAFKEIHREMREKIEDGETEISDYSMFFFSLCFDFKLHFDHIESLLEEIQESDFDKLEKSTLTESLVKMLNDYLYVNAVGKDMFINFEYSDSENNSIKVTGFDSPFYSLPLNEQTTVFKYMDFDRIYNFMKKAQML